MELNTREKVVCINAIKSSCKECRLRKLCFASYLNVEDLTEFNEALERPRPLARGEHIFHMGDRVDRFYIVRSGSLKTYILTPDGCEKITGFCLPGDVVGLDSIGSDVHTSSVEALDTTSLCVLPMDCVPRLRNPECIEKKLLNLASEQIRCRNRLITLLGKECAHQRVASFVIDLAERYESLGYSAEEFNLSMTRRDIGNYLKMAIETVSRVFAKLRDLGLIEVERRRVRIVEPERLRDFADTAERPEVLNVHFG